MNYKKILGWILKVPMIFLIGGSFIAGIYAAYNKIGGRNYVTPIIMLAIIVAYFIGDWLIVRNG